MKQLLRVELLVLRNLVRTADGRRALLLNVVVLVFFLVGAAAITSRFLPADLVAQIAAVDEGPLVVHRILALSFVPVVMLTFIDGMKSGAKNLFEGAQPELLMTMPVSRTALVTRAWIRMSFLNVLWAWTLTAPPAARLLPAVGAPGWAHALVPFACVVVVLPCVAIALLGHVLIMRFLGTPRVKRVLTVALAIAGVVVLALLFAGLVGPGESMQAAATSFVESQREQPQLEWILASFDPPASVVALAWGGPWSGPSLLVALALLVLGPLATSFAARFYPVAFENDRVAEGATARTRGRVRRRGWPRGVAASVARKDVLALVQQPSSALGILFVAVFLCFAFDILHLGRIIDPAAHHPADTLQLVDIAHIPDGLRHTAAMLVVLGWTMFMMVPGIVTGLTANEKKQWSLLATSPAPRRDVLLGKLRPPFGYFVGYSVVIALVAALREGVGLRGVVGFLLLAWPLCWIALALPIAIGTLPLLARPDSGSVEGPQASGSGRAVITATLTMVSIALLWIPAYVAWSALADLYSDGTGMFAWVGPRWTPLLLIAALVVFATAARAIALGVAARNFAKMTEPALE